jgi:hypothetical protein
MTNDYKGKTQTATITAINTDLVENSGINYLIFNLHKI